MKKVQESKVYTFSVDMVIQVFAEDELQAQNKLDQEGGYITNRTTELLNVVKIPNSKDKK
jgi:uncharacterized protein YpuA (DUF1002 family)